MINDLLPSSSLVAHQAQALTNAAVVWQGPLQLTSGALTDYAYAMPLPGDSDTAYTPVTRTFFAERYGGAGLKSNGGGARCGIWGDAQVKGLGRNCLAGTQTSFWHSYGGASLAECIREAIWGEVCHAALPWGAVRLFGVIGTSTVVPASDGSAIPVPRGLAVREIAARPAHFVRANYFSRRDEVQHGLMPDHARTSAAVRQFHRICQQSLATGDPHASLLEIARRAGGQLAAASAKRIAHGALTASNFCLDGRWLDFGTISTVSDFGRIIVANGMPDACEQLTLLRATISDLRDALIRYLPPDEAVALAPISVYWQAVTASHVRARALEFAKLSGIPAERLGRAPPDLIKQMDGCVQQIIASGNREPFKLFDNPLTGSPQMPAQMGSYALSSIMVTLATAASPTLAERMLETELADTRLRRNTISAYWALRQHYLAGASTEVQQARVQFCAFNAVRVNTALPGLYRHQLEARIDALLAEQENVATFITREVDAAGAILNEPDDGQIRLGGVFPGLAATCSEQGLCMDGAALSAEHLLDQAAKPNRSEQVQKLRRLLCNTVI